MQADQQSYYISEIRDDGYHSDGDETETFEASRERRTREQTVVEPTSMDKFFITICLFCAEIALAVCMRILGPTLLDIMQLLKVHSWELSRVFVARAAGYFVGAIAAGLVYQFFNRVFLLGLLIYSGAITLFCIPVVEDYRYLNLVLGIQGLAVGMAEPAICTFILDVWGARAGSFVQMIYFGYGIGAAITPQITKPFLLPVNETAQLNSTSWLQSYDYDRFGGAAPGSSTYLLHVLRESAKLTWPYEERSIITEDAAHKYGFFLAGGICALFGTMFFVYLCLRPGVRFKENTPWQVKATIMPRQSTTPTNWVFIAIWRLCPNEFGEAVTDRLAQAIHRDPTHLAREKRQKYPLKKVVLLISSCLLALAAAGVTTLTGIFLVSVTVRNHMFSISKELASDFNSITWVIFAVSRGLAWMASLLMSPVFILTSAWGFVFIGATSMQLFPIYEQELSQQEKVMAFMGSVWTWSLGMGPFLPSLLNVLKNFLRMNHLETSIIFSGRALGDLIPFFANFLLANDPHLWVIVSKACVVNFIALGLTIFIVIWGYLVVRRAAEKEPREATPTRDGGTLENANDAVLHSKRGSKNSQADRVND